MSLILSLSFYKSGRVQIGRHGVTVWIDSSFVFSFSFLASDVTGLLAQIAIVPLTRPVGPNLGWLEMTTDLSVSESGPRSWEA